jgi:hypothetical protein
MVNSGYKIKKFIFSDYKTDNIFLQKMYYAVKNNIYFNLEHYCNPFGHTSFHAEFKTNLKHQYRYLTDGINNGESVINIGSNRDYRYLFTITFNDFDIRTEDDDSIVGIINEYLKNISYTPF